MKKSRSYFHLLEAAEEPGCPLCALVVKDSRRYLDSLMYERVLDVPTRLELMDSFGFCGWHAWQIPSLPAICSPATGYAILASDLLTKFDFVTRARLKKSRRNGVWKNPFRKLYHTLFSLLKSKPCPACVRIAQAESYYFKDLVEFIQDELFLPAYQASDGICLPHFFRIERVFSGHPNFPTLVQLQLSKIQALRDILEEYIRKQDHRFRDQITSDEAKAWWVALELLVGKPGVFVNEMRHEL